MHSNSAIPFPNVRPSHPLSHPSPLSNSLQQPPKSPARRYYLPSNYGFSPPYPLHGPYFTANFHELFAEPLVLFTEYWNKRRGSEIGVLGSIGLVIFSFWALLKGWYAIRHELKHTMIVLLAISFVITTGWAITFYSIVFR